MKNKYFLLILYLFLSYSCFSQDTIFLTLDEAVENAYNESFESKEATHNINIARYRYKSYLADRIPSLTFNAELPGLNRSIEALSMPDGSEAFVQRRNLTYSADIIVKYAIEQTGGYIELKTGIRRLDVMDQTKITSFLATPVSISITQPLNGYNELKFNKKIENKNIEESTITYISKKLEIRQKVTEYFFEILLLELEKQIASDDMILNEEISKIMEIKKNLGKISEVDYLQININFLSSKENYQHSKVYCDIKYKEFKNLIDRDGKFFSLILPANNIPIDDSTAIYSAEKYNPALIENQRLLAESDKNLAKSKSEKMFNANLFAIVGLTNTTDNMTTLYSNMNDFQTINIGISIPLFDNGKSKINYLSETENRTYLLQKNEQTILEIEQNLTNKLIQLRLLEENLKIQSQKDSLSNQQYEIAKLKLKRGDIDLQTFGNIRLNNINYKTSYINSLKEYQLLYLEIMKLTLYDFENNISLPEQYQIVR